MAQVIGLAVLAGLISSALFLSLSSGLPGMVLAAYFVQLPLLFVGLSLGLAASAIAVGGAILICGLLAGVIGTGLFVLVQAVPAMVVIRQSLLARQANGRLEWYPPGSVLAQLTALAALAITAAFVLLLGRPGGLEGVIADYLSAALTELGVPAVGVTAGSEPGRWLFQLPGLMAASWRSWWWSTACSPRRLRPASAGTAGRPPRSASSSCRAGCGPRSGSPGCWP
jgi:hypothetical protein